MSLEEKIIEKIEKSGYPLEIKVALTLQSKGWHVLNQQGYIDPETNKWRAIDILATKSVELSESIYQTISLVLIIECKKIESPWVFWCRDKEPLRIFDPLAAFGLIKLDSKPPFHPLDFENFIDCFHYYSSGFNKVAVISYEPLRESGKEVIFEAKVQVIKSLSAWRRLINNFLSMRKNIEKLKPKSKPFNPIYVYYPLIIVDGNLFEMEFKDEEIKLTEVDYIQYLTSFIHYSTISLGEQVTETYLIDIMKIDFLKKYLDIIEKKAQQFANRLPSIQSISKVPFL
jgi:hypothetical protein